MQIAGSAVLIAGGASGLGAACARRLCAAGARCLLVDLPTQPVAELLAELGTAARFFAADVTSAEQVAQAMAAGQQAFGRLNAAIQCAGVAPAGRILSREGPHSLELFERVVRVNLVGTFNVLRLVAAVLAENPPDAEGERGVIINTASVAAFEGQIGQAAYAASKAGVVGLTLPAARELARQGIRVLAIAPGVFETPLVAAMPPAVREALAAQVPFPPRFGRPEEFAALVEHALTNTMLNGEVIRLDGAIRMAPK